MVPIPAIEQAGPQAIRQFQEERLRELVSYLQQHSPYYRQLFVAQNIQPEDVRTLADLAQLPLTTKEQLQQHNLAFRCVTPAQVADYVTTSGTSGDPVLLALTDSDLERLAYNEALSYQCMGLSEGSTIQLTTTIDRRFMAGLAYFLGARN